MSGYRPVYACALLLALLGGLPSISNAAGTAYTNETAFAAAVGPLTTVGFDGIIFLPTKYKDYSTSAGGYTDLPTNTNFNFLQSHAYLNITGASFYGFPNDVLNGSVDVYGSSQEIITLHNPMQAFGTDFTSFDGLPFTFVLSNGDQFTDSSAPTFGNFLFYGFTDDTPFTTVIITRNAALLEDVRFSPVPEPSTLGLVGLGCAVLAQRRIRHAAIAGWT
jgi:hypothetical protein